MEAQTLSSGQTVRDPRYVFGFRKRFSSGFYRFFLSAELLPGRQALLRAIGLQLMGAEVFFSCF